MFTNTMERITLLYHLGDNAVNLDRNLAYMRYYI